MLKEPLPSHEWSKEIRIVTLLEIAPTHKLLSKSSSSMVPSLPKNLRGPLLALYGPSISHDNGMLICNCKKGVDTTISFSGSLFDVNCDDGDDGGEGSLYLLPCQVSPFSKASSRCTLAKPLSFWRPLTIGPTTSKGLVFFLVERVRKVLLGCQYPTWYLMDIP